MFYFKKGHVICVFGNMREKKDAEKVSRRLNSKKKNARTMVFWVPYSVFQA